MNDETYDLYDGVPPHSDDGTSREAAERALPGVVRRRARVLALLKERGEQGATDDEIEEALGYPHQTASARRRELVLLGLAVDSGSRRETRNGRRARVWRAGSGAAPVVPQQRVVSGMPQDADIRRALIAARSMYRTSMALHEVVPHRDAYIALLQWLGTLVDRDGV